MTITIGNSQGIPMGKYTPSTGGGGGGGGTVSVAEKYGVQGDYATHYGILDCPNGLITYSLGKDIIIEPGIVLQAAGSDTKTTIASAINYTIVEDTDVTLFYAEGTILEAGAVYYQTEEPTDGDVGYLAWFNPEIMQWQFKSDDTGNVWRTAVATPIANVRIVDGNITRLDYMGYRILDDDIIAHKQDVDELEALLDEKQDVLTPTAPINIGTTTIGEPNNISVLNGVITPAVVSSGVDLTYVHQDALGLRMQFEDTANTSNFNDLFAGHSYFDIPISFSNYFTDDYSSVQSISVNIKDLNSNYAGNSFTFFAGQLTGEGFKPYIVSQVYTLGSNTVPEGGVAIADGVVKPTRVPSSSSTTRQSYGVPLGAYAAASVYTVESTVKYAYFNIFKKITGELSVTGRWRTTGNNKTSYQADASLGLGAWQLSDLQSCNVIRVVMNWASSSYATSAYLPTSENVYVTANSVRLPWNIESGIVKIYGISLKYDNQTLQVNSEGKLVVNLDELGNEVNAISGRVTALENNDPKTSIINEVTSGVIGKAYNSDGTEVTDLTSQVVDYPTLYKPKSVIAFSKQDSIEIAGKATFKTIYDSSAGVCFEVFKRENNTVQLNHRLQRLWGESIVGLVVDNMAPQETFSINEGDTVRFIYKYNGGANTVELLYAINADTNFTSLGVVNASTPYASEGSDEAYIQLSPELNDRYPSSSSGVVEFPADYTVKINGNLVFSGNWVEPFIDNKADADLSNCTRPYIVEAYRDGYSWRRIYSDGWCEQGGRVLSGEWQGTTQLLKAYKDTNYNIIGTIARNGWGTSTDAYNYFVSAEPANNDSFLWATIGHAGTQGFRPFQWYACGYIE